MSMRTSVAGSSSRWRQIVAFAAVLMLVAGMARIGASPVAAQDATPMAAMCTSPGLPPGTPEPEASPEASMDDMDMGTPAAMEAAVAPEAPAGTPADDASAAAITAALENYIACYNEAVESGDFSNVTALETPNQWMIDTGDTNPYNRNASQVENNIGHLDLQSVSNQMTYEDGSVSGDVQLISNGVFGTGFRVFLVQDGEYWLFDHDMQISAEPEADMVSTKGLSVTEAVDDAGAKTYTLAWAGAAEIPQTDAILFNLSSVATNTEVHEFIFLKIPDGADPAGLLDGSLPFEQVQFLGGAFQVYPGQFIDVAYYNLEPGTYAVVCFFDGPDGQPHAAHGMVTSFTIVAPAA